MSKANNASVVDWTDKDAKASFLEENPDFKAQKKEIARLKLSLEKERATTLNIIQAAKDAYSGSTKLAIPKCSYKAKKSKEEIATLHISDTQIGKETFINGVPVYSSEIAGERLLLLVEKTIEITELRRNSATINECRVYLGGDIVEGEDIFAGQPHEIDQTLFDQACKTAPTIIAQCILRLLEVFPKVHVCAVSGNHGRNGRKGTSASLKTNWDSVCYQMVYWMLMGSEPAKKAGFDKRLSFNIEEDSFYTVDYVFDWGNLMVHGHQIRGFGGFPWNGAAKKAFGWIDSIEAPWDYLWFGHFHTYASAVLNQRVFLCNGTTESGNRYAQEELAAGGYPCQRLAFFDADHGLISDNQVYLDDTRRPQKKRQAAWM